MSNPSDQQRLTVAPIKKRPEYLRVAAGRRKWVTPSFIVQFMPEGGAGPQVRAGFTVTKKVGKATIRNKVRRRMKALSTELLPLYGRAGCAYVFIGRSGAYTAPFEKLKKDMQWALEKLAKDADLKGSKKGGKS